MRSLAAVFAALVASPALAQPAPPATSPPPANEPPAYTPTAYPPVYYNPPRSTLYLAITGGVLFPNDVNASRSRTIGGVPTTASGTIKFNNTYVASGILGIQLGQYVSFEIEGGYTHLKSKGGTGSLTRAGGAATPGVVSGSGNAYLGFGNLLIWPFGADAPLAPYLGGGGGVAAFKGSADIANASLGDVSISTDGRQTAPAAAAIAGIDFGAPGIFRIGARYKYLWLGINSSRNFKEVQAQAVTAVISARF
jgi:hypothetical protein